jgi:hypothetical protein
LPAAGSGGAGEADGDAAPVPALGESVRSTLTLGEGSPAVLPDDRAGAPHPDVATPAARLAARPTTNAERRSRTESMLGADHFRREYPRKA